MVNRFARPTPATLARYRSERNALLAQARANYDASGDARLSTAAWRAEVARRKAERAAARTRAAALTPGTRLRFPQPLRFRGFEAALFELVPPRPRQRRLVFLAVGHGALCRLRPGQIAAAELVPPGGRSDTASRAPSAAPEGDAP